MVSRLSSSTLRLNSHSRNLTISSSSIPPNPTSHLFRIWSLMSGSMAAISRMSSSPGFLVPCLAKFQNNAGRHPSTSMGLKHLRILIGPLYNGQETYKQGNLRVNNITLEVSKYQSFGALTKTRSVAFANFINTLSTNLSSVFAVTKYEVFVPKY